MKRLLLILLVTVFSFSNAFGADEFANKKIEKIYTYASVDKVIFKFSPSQSNSCQRDNFAMVDTSTDAGKQTLSALLTARAMGLAIDFRGTTGDCSDYWTTTMIQIYRLDY